MNKCHYCGKEIKGYKGAKTMHMACAFKACAKIREEVLKGVPEKKKAREG